YTNCKYGSSTATQLGFPNAACAGASPITITNGTTPANILVNGADMIPADNGTHWTLCMHGGLADPPACTGDPLGPPGSTQLPGANEYEETTSPNPGGPLDNTGPGPWSFLANTPRGDVSFAGTAAAGAQATDYLYITGPKSSSDPSTSWSTSVTWTAS